MGSSSHDSRKTTKASDFFRVVERFREKRKEILNFCVNNDIILIKIKKFKK